jgi:UDP-GlcNAc:undecaprenyl-phosphate GlcNAc-1-phosphate transferase
MDTILAIFIPFVFSFFSFPLAQWAGYRYELIDYPSVRKIHTSPTLKVGGMIILSGYILGVVILKTLWWQIGLCLILIFITGILGDKDILGPKKRLVLQSVFALLFIIFTGASVRDLKLFQLPSYLQIPFTVLGIVGITNAYNIIDGMNGLCSSLGIIALMTIGILGGLYDSNYILMHTLIFSSSVGAFLIFNLKGKTFMGDAGSYMIGFMVGSLSVVVASKVPYVSPYAFFLNSLIPIFDTVFAIYRRKRLSRDPFKADKRHLHHMLSRRYKSNKRSLIVLTLTQIILSSLAVLFHKSTPLLIIFILIATLFLRRLWFKRIKILGIVL